MPLKIFAALLSASISLLMLPVSTQALPKEVEGGSTHLDIPSVEQKEKRTFYHLTTGFSSLSSTTQSLQGIDIGFKYKLVLNDSWAIYAWVDYGLNTSGNETLYTLFDGGFSYTLWGSHIARSSNVKLSGVNLTESREFVQSSLSVDFGVKQYFFNATNNVVPVTGPGVLLLYRFPSAKSYNLEAGAGYDMAQNGNITINNTRFIFGIQF